MNTNTTANVNTAKNVEAAATRTVTIADPESKATDTQLRCISRAIKQGAYNRIPEDKWKALTKGDASLIIDEIREKVGDLPASWSQKHRFIELVRDGFLRGVKKETFEKMTTSQASKMIYIGMLNKESGTKVEPYIRQNAPVAA